MLLSLALIFLLGISAGEIFRRLRLPPLLGMLIVGILLGPSQLNLLDESVLAISTDIRKIALIIILTRAGLNLNLTELKKVGVSATLMCFIPAIFEICGMIVLAPPLLGLTILESAILGTVIAAVSPAVIVPKMLKLMEEGYGVRESVPQMIMAGASVDDVFVIVLFEAFTGLASGGTMEVNSLLQIPLRILLGIIIGAILGKALSLFFQKLSFRDTVKILIVLSLSFILVTIEDSTISPPFSGLLAIMSMGIALQKNLRTAAARLSEKYAKLWVASELLLFVLVGATVDLEYALKAGTATIFLILSVTVCRMVGVFFSLCISKLNWKERLFCMIAYCPKATVQAAIGSIPLAMGLSCGEIVLTVAVLAILITAPLGALAIDLSYKKLLKSSHSV